MDSPIVVCSMANEAGVGGLRHTPVEPLCSHLAAILQELGLFFSDCRSLFDGQFRTNAHAALTQPPFIVANCGV